MGDGKAVCAPRLSPAFVPRVCALRLSPAFVPRVCPPRLPPAFVPRVCPPRLSPALVPRGPHRRSLREGPRSNRIAGRNIIQ